MLGVLTEFGLGHVRDLSLAVKHYTISSNKDCPDAMNHLARLYEIGKGCQVSSKTAAMLYKKAAGLGHVDAMTNWGYMLENGIGCKADQALAVETYKMAVDKEYARAQNALGSCYYRGIGVETNLYTAFGLFKKSADQVLSNFIQGIRPSSKQCRDLLRRGARDPIGYGSSKSILPEGS